MISMPFMRCDVPNQNLRIYPREVVKKAISEYLDIEASRRLGCITPGPEFSETIQFDEVSHRVDDIFFLDNSDVVAARITPTGPKKDLLAKLIAEGCVLRPMGFADLTENPDGTSTVSNYKLTSINVCDLLVHSTLRSQNPGTPK